jgi:hypothetical protein
MEKTNTEMILDRPRAELIIYRNIESLKKELETEKNTQKKREIEEQISQLTAQLEMLSGPSPEELLKEVQELRKKNTELEQKKNMTNQEQNTPETENKLLDLYTLLLGKYSEIINDFEKKTVGELKELVNPNELTIQSLIPQFTGNNYHTRAKQAYEYVQKEITFVKSKIKINFWLTPREIMKHKIGDDEDQAVFLCTLLHALEDTKAEIILTEMTDHTSHAFVMTEINEKTYILDPTQNTNFDEYSGTKKNALEKYEFKKAKIKRFLYKFNNQKYEQFI